MHFKSYLICIFANLFNIHRLQQECSNPNFNDQRYPGNELILHSRQVQMNWFYTLNESVKEVSHRLKVLSGAEPQISRARLHERKDCVEDQTAIKFQCSIINKNKINNYGRMKRSARGRKNHPEKEANTAKKSFIYSS